MADDRPTIISCTEARALGLKRYFTGGLCPSGHCAPRYVSNRRCVACVRLEKAQWAKTNPSKVRAYDRAYYQANRQLDLQRNRKWRAENPEKLRAIKRAEYRRNKASHQRRMRRYRELNPELLREAARRKVAKNPEKYASYARNRKARRRLAPGSHSGADVRAIHKAQKGKCAICRSALSGKYHVDHIQALANGGSNDPRNLQILCPPCNMRKGARDQIEFMRERGMLL